MFSKQSTSNISINLDIDKAVNNFCSFDDVFNVNKDLKDFIDDKSQTVIITEHLCIPCPRLYTDIFKTVLIICKDPSHKDDKYTDDGNLNRIIQQLLVDGSKNIDN